MTLSIKRKIHKTKKRNRNSAGGVRLLGYNFGYPSNGDKAAADKAAADQAAALEKAAADQAAALEKAAAIEPSEATTSDQTSASNPSPEDEPDKVSTPQHSNCETKKNTIMTRLKANKIEYFLPDESNDVSKSRAQQFVDIAKKTERTDAAIQVVNNFGVIPGAGIAVGAVCSLSKTATLGLSKYAKYNEIAYLSSECLSFVANISKDLVEMNAFYASDIARQANLAIDVDIYGSLQKSLYKFLYFLIDSIDFTMTGLGQQQYSFWYKLLLKIDFNEANYNKAIQANEYRYSCGECIPSDLREALIDESKKLNGNPKPLVNFNKVGVLEVNQDTPEQSFIDNNLPQYLVKVGRIAYDNPMTRFAGNTGRSAYNSIPTKSLTSSLGSVGSYAANTGRVLVNETANLGRGALNMEKKYIKHDYGFCSNALVNLCKNENDTVVRLIEYNMYKLIDTTYNERVNIFSKLFKDIPYISKEDFFDYLFNPHDEDKILYVDQINKLEEKLEKTPDANSLTTQEGQKEEVRRREALICFKFLVELRRIIKDLDYKRLPSPTKVKSGYISSTLYVGARSFVGNPVTTYNQLMRDFMMMNGYFTSATSRYSLDINKLEVDEVKKKELFLQIKKDTAQITTALDTVTTAVASEAQTLDALIAAQTTDDPANSTNGEVQRSVDVQAVGGKKLHRRSKKYRRSKKLKNKRNKMKQNRN